jgi:hypothetical protein
VNAKRALASVLAVVLGFGVGSALVAGTRLRDDGPGGVLGELDFFAYCASTYAPTSRAVIYGNDAYGWRCMVFEPLYATLEIDPDEACSVQYGVDAEARTADPASPYRWRCYQA